MIRVLFVCLGNICRSPMAEAVFRHLVQQSDLTRQIHCDSAGTAGYHINALPDQRTRQVLRQHGIPTEHRGRQVLSTDYTQFDYLVAMDHSNYRHLARGVQEQKQPLDKVLMMGRFDPAYQEGQPAPEVPDPYYGDLTDFEEVYEMLLPCCEHFLATIRQAHGL